ncbi:MAG: DUF6473 family protein [Planctomycetota bacterium]
MVEAAAEHLAGYQARDYEVVDYQLYELDGTELTFRGPPAATAEGKYVACLGAAQTFGCFVEQPYPKLLESELRVPTLNLGYGGAGPRFYNRHPEVLDIINRGRLAIVQVMSGRSEDNSKFESKGLEVLTRRSDGRSMSADAAWRSILELRYAWKKMPLGRALARSVCRRVGASHARKLLRETRENWISSYCQLLKSIEVPTVLFWFSKRTPDFEDSYEDLHRLMGIYPQLVTRNMVEAIRPYADFYVECSTQKGSPQPLRSRFDGSAVEVDLGRDRADFAGQTWKENRYYPSPEMHEDAAAALSRTLRQILDA